MILRDEFSITDRDHNYPCLTCDSNPFKWVSPQSLEILCSLLLTRIQAEDLLQHAVDSQEVKMLRIGALYRNLAIHAAENVCSGRMLYQELQSRIQDLISNNLNLSFPISQLSTKWTQEKNKACSTRNVDTKIAIILLWKLVPRKGAWSRHLEQSVVCDVYSLAIRALSPNLHSLPKIR